MSRPLTPQSVVPQPRYSRFGRTFVDYALLPSLGCAGQRIFRNAMRTSPPTSITAGASHSAIADRSVFACPLRHQAPKLVPRTIEKAPSPMRKKLTSK